MISSFKLAFFLLSDAFSFADFSFIHLCLSIYWESIASWFSYSIFCFYISFFSASRTALMDMSEFFYFSATNRVFSNIFCFFTLLTSSNFEESCSSIYSIFNVVTWEEFGSASIYVSFIFAIRKSSSCTKHLWYLLSAFSLSFASSSIWFYCCWIIIRNYWIW